MENGGVVGDAAATVTVATGA